MVKASLDFLRSHGVQVFVCNNTLAENGIDYRTLYKVSDADIVPSGFLEVAYLQARRNYIVDPAN
jgi:intracellular sulfur oxidation DsrE/DsrF family protein